jgi:hypothetical protein
VTLLGGWLGDGLPSWGKVETYLDHLLGLSAWTEGPAEPPLPLGVLAASPMLGRSSTAAALAAPFVGALPASWPGPSGAQGVMSATA